VTISANVVWQPTRVDRACREQRLAMRGATVWFTGLPSSGKSTLACAVEERLTAEGVPAYVLDGDNLRHGLNADLGFTGEARAENVRRTAHVASLLSDAGVVALVSLVSPYVADRALARRLHDEASIPFVEVFLNVPVSVCEQRDPKGLYARARLGEICDFTGVDHPYEPPVCPEVEIAPTAPLSVSVDAVVSALDRRRP
jgi:adenylyl-sulfate kinase